MKLNLQATTKEEQKVKAYLEANASEVLAEKINGGVRIQKDGKMLINKKTLAGFMKFACDEAKKQAEKGASSACIDDDTVYGWAVHYFEEDSIEGTLYNEDGTEYKAPMPKVTAKAPAVKSVPPKPQPKPQMSMFDLMGEDLEGKPEEEKPEDDEDTMPSDEEIQEIMAEIAEEEKTKPSKRTASPMYRKYLDVQEKYPQAVIAMRLGDFYEVFGKNAEMLADELHLTLTGRDCGLESRVIRSSSWKTAMKCANCLPNKTSILKRERYSPKKRCANLTATWKNPTLRTMSRIFPLSIRKRLPFWMKCSATKLH